MGGCVEKAVALQAVAQDGTALQRLSREMKDDKDVVMRAAEQNPHALQHASPAMKDDKDVVLRAVAKKGQSLKHASERLRGDKEVVLQAIQNSPFGAAFEHASADLRGDKNFVMSAVASKWWSLKFASERLRGDKEVVLQAIRRHGDALEHASDDLKGDRDVVMLAISVKATAVEYASASLKRDKQVGLEVVRRGGYRLYLHKELQNDPDIMRAEQAKYQGLTAGTERITFEGEIAQKKGVPCYTSFPGKHAKEWNGLTRKAKAGNVSTACVFLTTKDAGLGRHSSPCLCHTIYGKVPADKYVIVLDKKPDISDMEYEKQIADAKKDSKAMELTFLERNAYPTEAEWKDAYNKALEQAEERAKARNYAAPWGCWWFALWKQKVEEARKLQQELVAVFFPAKCGKGKVKWSELADKEKIEQALRDNGLGFSQRAEVAWLEHCGYKVREIDLTTFCQECGLDESTA